MQVMLDIKVLELLGARICHDLISPVSAIGNGVELVTEFDDQMQGEALALIGESAKAASRLLQFYRAAVGSARSSEGGTLEITEARLRTLEALGGGRIHINWPEPVAPSKWQVPRLGVKLLMNMVLLATDLLPGAGEVIVTMSPDNGEMAIEMTAIKDGFALSGEYRAAISGTAAGDELTPRTVIGHYCHMLAKALGCQLTLVERADGVSLQTRFPLSAMA